MNRTVLAVACLFLLGAPLSAPFAQTKATPPVATTPAATVDQTAMKILEKSRDTMFALKTFRAECWETTTFSPTAEGKNRPNHYEMSTLIAAKPNLMRYDKWDMTAPDSIAPPAVWKRKKNVTRNTIVNNGKAIWRQSGDSYSKNNDPGAQFLTTYLEPWEGFYSTGSSPYNIVEYYVKKGELFDLRAEGTKTMGDILCDVVRYRIKFVVGAKPQEIDRLLYVGRDGIVRRQIDTARSSSKQGYVCDAVIRNISTNVLVKSSDTVFVYIPPKDAKNEGTVEYPKSQPDPQSDEERVLLTSGTVAPDFSAADVNGAMVKMSDLRGKVVVVDFWASWCGPCVASMPHNQRVIKKLKTEGVPVVLLAIDNSEGRDDFARWVKKHPELDALRFVHADRETTSIARKLYHVSSIPTQYIVDANGVIRSSSVGYSGENGNLEKAIRAALAPKNN